MIRIFRFLGLSLILLVNSCIKEEESFLPVVQTGDVTSITSKGATLNGKLIHASDDIIEYGFIWDYKPPNFDDSYKISFNDPREDVYHYEIRSALFENRKYFVRAYVGTSSRLIVGRLVTFTSVNSLDPQLNGLIPAVATWGDTIRIAGKNLSTRRLDSEVSFINTNTISVEPLAVNDSSIYVKVPNILARSAYKISLNMLDRNYFLQDSFRLKSPELIAFSPRSGNFDDLVTINGKYFRQGLTKVFFDDVRAEIVQIDEEQVVVHVPTAIDPDIIGDRQYKIRLEVIDQSAEFDETFEIKLPVVSGFSPESGTWNDEVIISGSNFGSSIDEITVRFNDAEATIVEASDSELKVSVPPSLNNQVSQISVEYVGMRGFSSNSFTLNSPVIRGFDPSTATFGDVINISGEYFNPVKGYNQVKLGQWVGEIVEVGSNYIRAVVPEDYQQFEDQFVSLIIGDMTAVSQFPFQLKLHQINGISDNEIDRSTTFTILGNNFNSNTSLNQVFLGAIELDILSGTTEELTVQLPDSVNHGSFAITVRTGARDVTSGETVMVYEPFRRLNDFPGEARQDVFSFAIGDKGYIAGGFAEDPADWLQEMYEYDPSLDTWSRMNDIPFFTSSPSFTASETHGYVYTTDNTENGLYEYDPSTDSWVYLTTYPGLGTNPSILFYKEGYLYFSGGVYRQYFRPDREYIWKYDIANDTWISLSQFGFPSDITDTFVIQGVPFRRYQRYFYRYDEISDTWSPSFEYGAYNYPFPAIFSIGGSGYTVGGGFLFFGDYHTDEVYEYNWPSETTRQLVPMPKGGRTRSAYFVINNKGYIGLGGGTFGTRFKDFYEFDPLKIKP